MEDALSNFLNEVKEFIPDDKLNKFNKCITKFEKDNNIQLNIQWNARDIAAIIVKKAKKVPVDLEKRLNETFAVGSVKFDINEESSDEEIVDTCMKIFNHLDDIEKRNKGFYYNLGYLLSILKSRYNNEKEFLAYAKEKFNRSKTIITDYIRFYTICIKYTKLMNCNLSYREIMRNLPEIREILSDASDDFN
jgi:cellulose biosynthesis protein BcsQ